MNNVDKRYLYIGFLLTLISGLVYGWMIYMIPPENEWDIMNHPFQKYFQASHIIFSPILVFALGLIWDGHIRKKFRIRETKKKRTGMILVLLVIPMVLSGYFIQVSQSVSIRDFNKIVHLASSAVWSLVFIYHAWGFKRI